MNDSPTKESSSSRIVYLDVLRVLATFAVITIHVSANKWGSADVASFEWQVFSMYDSLVRWAVPMFVMISGVLFLDPDRTVPTRKIFTKYIPRIICAFAFWSVAYALFEVFAMQSIHTKSELFAQLVKGEYHLWFLYMIVGLYIVVPILRKVTADSVATRYFLAVALVFSFAIPTVTALANTLLPLLGWDWATKAAKSVAQAYDYMKFHLTLQFVSYFVLGYFLSRSNLSKRKRIALYALGAAGLMFTVLFSSFIALQKGEAYGFHNSMYITTMFAAVAIFVLVKQFDMKRIAQLSEPSEPLNDSGGSARSRHQVRVCPKLWSVFSACYGA